MATTASSTGGAAGKTDTAAAKTEDTKAGTAGDTKTTTANSTTDLPTDAPADRKSLMERVARRAPHVDDKFISTYGLTDQDLTDIATGLQPAPPAIGPIKTVDLHRTPGGWQITPVGVAPADLPETGRVHADEASPGPTRTQGETQAMGTGLTVEDSNR